MRKNGKVSLDLAKKENQGVPTKRKRRKKMTWEKPGVGRRTDRRDLGVWGGGTESGRQTGGAETDQYWTNWGKQKRRVAKGRGLNPPQVERTEPGKLERMKIRGVLEASDATSQNGAK